MVCVREIDCGETISETRNIYIYIYTYLLMQPKIISKINSCYCVVVIYNIILLPYILLVLKMHPYVYNRQKFGIISCVLISLPVQIFLYNPIGNAILSKFISLGIAIRFSTAGFIKKKKSTLQKRTLYYTYSPLRLFIGNPFCTKCIGDM